MERRLQPQPYVTLLGPSTLSSHNPNIPHLVHLLRPLTPSLLPITPPKALKEADHGGVIVKVANVKPVLTEIIAQ